MTLGEVTVLPDYPHTLSAMCLLTEEMLLLLPQLVRVTI